MCDLLKPYPAKNSICVQISVAASSGMPRAVQPSTNFALNFAMTSGFFLPMALRSVSASLSEKPASTFATRITCSW